MILQKVVGIPINCIFSHNKFLSTKSNAFLKSTKQAYTFRLEPRLFSIECLRRVVADTVDRFFLKPN